MKKFKKMMALVIAMVMALAMAIPAMAADSDYKITVTNSNDSISIDGQTYNAYKLFDLSYNTGKTAYSYTLSTSSYFYTTTGAKAVLEDYFTLTPSAGDSTVLIVEPKTDGTYYDTNTKTISDAGARKLADDLQEYLASATPVKTGTASGESCVIDVGEDGYFIVTGDAKPTDPKSNETVVSAVILTNAEPTASVEPKVSIPTLDKKITGVTENGAVLDEAGKAAVAKVGATVSYQLDSITPDLRGYDNYTFTIGDQVTAGLTYVPNSFKLTIDGSVVNIAPTVTGQKFTLTIPYNTLKNYDAGTAVVLTYDCTVNSDALITDYENNTANLEYSNNPYDNTTNHTPDKKTYVIDLNIDVNKVAESATGSKLAGATFKLYKLVDTEKLYYKWANNKVTWVEGQDNGDAFVTDDQGKLTTQVRGLDQGTYYLEETVAPDGYNKLDQPVEVTISAALNSDKVTYTSEDAAITNGTVDLTAAQNSNQPVATATIINNAGSVLPSTGGIGTTLFYLFGTILVIGAGVLLVTRRRMNAN